MFVNQVEQFLSKETIANLPQKESSLAIQSNEISRLFASQTQQYKLSQTEEKNLIFKVTRKLTNLCILM